MSVCLSACLFVFLSLKAQAQESEALRRQAEGQEGLLQTRSQVSYGRAGLSEGVTSSHFPIPFHSVSFRLRFPPDNDEEMFAAGEAGSIEGVLVSF